MKKNKPKPVLLTVQQVADITGRSTRQAKRIMSAIRKSFEKEPYTAITIDEFCAFTKIKEERVMGFLE